MSKAELFKRYCVFFLSVFMQGFSIGLITFGNIGVTPISSTNFVISIHSGMTLGEVTMIFNVLLIVLQIMIIGFKNLKYHLSKIIVQIPVAVIFSWAIDKTIEIQYMLLPHDEYYSLSWVLVLSGTVILALSIALSFTANVAMVSGEYFIKVFHPVVKKSFSFVKTFFDIFLVVAACVISLFMNDFKGIDGIREGTLFIALTTGPLVHFFIPRIVSLNKLLGPDGVNRSKG